jgi:hypothetical protein
MISVDVNAALAEVPVNLAALKDVGDGFTIEAAVAYNATGMTLFWNFMTPAGALTSTAVVPTTGGLHNWTDQGASGMYSLAIPASGGTINNDTEGFGWFTGWTDGVLPFTGPMVCCRDASLNDLLVENTYDTARGLAGNALPAAVADAVGGLPISDLGGLDMDSILADTNSLNDTKIPDILSLAAIQAEVDTSIETYELDHFFVTTYDPAAPPGTSTSWANELVESDGGITRFSANTLEQGPSGTISNKLLLVSTTIATVVDASNFTCDSGPADDDVPNQLTVIITDQSTGTQKSVRGVSDYTASGFTVVLTADADFLPATGDTIDFMAMPYVTLTGVNAEADTALTDYDPPTKAELDSGFAALNDLSAADVNTQADLALTDYDAPTNTEMLASFTALNDLSAAQVNAEADTALTDYDPPTQTEALATQASIQASITGLENVSTTDLLTQATAANVAHGLDHLVSAAVVGADIVDNSIIASLVSKEVTADWDDFVNTTDSLQAIKDGQGGSAPTAAAIRAEIDSNSTQLAAIVFDTGTTLDAAIAAIQVDTTAIILDTSTTLDNKIDAILLDTSSTIQNQILSLNNITSANVLTQVTAGLNAYDPPTKTELDTAQTSIENDIAALNDLSAAAVNTQVDIALADYDGPTNTEMLAAHTTTDGLIGALNDVSAAQVNAQVDTALADYNGPTHTELVTSQGVVTAAIAALNDLSAAQVNAEVDTALADYDGPTQTELLAAHTTTDALITGLNDLQTSDILTQVNTGLAAYDGPTNTEMLAAHTTTDALISGLNDIAAADVLTQATAANVAHGLDHIISAAVTGTDIVDDSIIASLVSKEAIADWDDFVNTTDSLQAIKDNQSTTAPSAADIRAEIDSNSTELATIKADAASILLDTGTTLSNQIAALNNITSANVLTQVTAGLNAYDPPTKTELDTAQTSIENDIAALNNVSSATVLSQVSAALATYDGPTNTEMLAAHTTTDALISGLNDLSAAQVNAQADLALSDYNGSTHSELVTSQTVVTNAIAALNDLSAAQVNAEVDTAFADYDPPTQIELLSAHTTTDALISGLEDLSAAQAQAQVTAALNIYDPPTQTELLAAHTTTDALVSGLNDISAANVRTELATELAEITATNTVLTGITTLADWLGALAGKTADATTLAEINATTAGTAYSNLTDSVEAVRDKIDTMPGTTVTAASIADAVLLELIADHSGTAGSLAATLSDILVDTEFIQILIDELVSGTTPNRKFTAAALENADGGVLGPGEDTVTITIEDDLIPIDDVGVWISTDAGGSNVVAGTRQTNGLGKVTFLLTAGATYYLWAQKSGQISIQGDLFVAVAD